MFIVLLGAPGSGKGPLSSKDPTLLFVLSLGAFPVSHGENLRKILFLALSGGKER